MNRVITLTQDSKYLKRLISKKERENIYKLLSGFLPEYKAKLLTTLNPVELAEINELDVY